ncbi:Saccharopine dehydrogenase-domain-containing protein [Entophlyctis helioformis]|nr:Saccharopine dehydrogenase-domain-containing protein [Entophlyctis helioformis]
MLSTYLQKAARRPALLRACAPAFSTAAPPAPSEAKSPRRLAIGIRREGKNRWERRVPLVPEHVERLTKELGVKVFVQPSTKRVIPDEKYREAGAVIHEDLSVADVILGVKEVPTNQMIPGKTYIYFSHTHKGQTYNMPMLQGILDRKIRLVDYELMTNEHGRRLVQFSKFAGYAGMIDGFHALGHRLLALGYGNPFLAVGMSYMYRALADARLDITRTGQVIMDDGLPTALGPMTFVFIGDGNVAKGAKHVFKCLPHEWVSPDELAALSSSTSFDNHKVYACQVTPEDYLVRKDGGKFSREEYFKHPELYESVFHEKIAPHARMIINGIFWTDKYPRLMTVEQTHQLAVENRLKLLTVADVSCDIHGSLEFMGHASTIDSPTYMYDPIDKVMHNNMEGRGIQIMSIDNLPTEMPLEASEYFSEALIPFVSELAKGNVNHPVIERASITTSTGELAPRHKHLEKVLAQHSPKEANISVTGHSKVLLLGSGYVAAPLVDYLLRQPGTTVTIASNLPDEANKLAGGRKTAIVAPLDVSNTAELGALVAAHDVVVSFVPATLHPIVAEQCLQHKKHLVTASYISPAMSALDQRAKDAGLTFINEVGLDPGIDHLTACQLFNDVKAKNGRITSFVSWCGGLPAPEVSDNPLGYKFSWSPKGVLLAGLNPAKFKRDGRIVEIPGDQLLHNAVDVPIFKGFAFEGLANRDSLKYTDLYNLGRIEDLDTMFRGTLRYKGYAELMGAFNAIGLLDVSERPDLRSGISWGRLMRDLLGKDVDAGLAKKLAAVSSQLSPAAALGRIDRVKSALSWMDMFSESHGVDPKAASVLDAFCSLLQRNLVYGPGERDMVAMHHVFGIEWANGTRESRTSTMIAYGDPAGYSAMAKTVGLPAAIATQMVLNGGLKRTGVVAPMTADIYEPMLVQLEREGVKFVESIVH